MVQTKAVQKIRTHIPCFYFSKLYRLRDYEEKYRRAWHATMTRRRTRYGYKHTQYVTLTYFPLLQWLHERCSVLRYMYIASCFALRRDQNAVVTTSLQRSSTQICTILYLNVTVALISMIRPYMPTMKFQLKNDRGGGAGSWRHKNLSSILTLRRLMSYIYGAPILDVSRSHTTTQHSR